MAILSNTHTWLMLSSLVASNLFAIQEWGITRLCYEVDTEPYAKSRDETVHRLATEASVEVRACISHTLYVSVDHAAA